MLFKMESGGVFRTVGLIVETPTKLENTIVWRSRQLRNRKSYLTSDGRETKRRQKIETSSEHGSVATSQEKAYPNPLTELPTAGEMRGRAQPFIPV